MACGSGDEGRLLVDISLGIIGGVLGGWVFGFWELDTLAG
jgi:uncharacterized membrane protein YeaQ/YmgE (transglycosylase-associated protein family)